MTTLFLVMAVVLALMLLVRLLRIALELSPAQLWWVSIAAVVCVCIVLWCRGTTQQEVALPTTSPSTSDEAIWQRVPSNGNTRLRLLI